MMQIQMNAKFVEEMRRTTAHKEHTDYILNWHRVTASSIEWIFRPLAGSLHAKHSSMCTMQMI